MTQAALFQSCWAVISVCEAAGGEAESVHLCMGDLRPRGTAWKQQQGSLDLHSQLIHASWREAPTFLLLRPFVPNSFSFHLDGIRKHPIWQSPTVFLLMSVRDPTPPSTVQPTGAEAATAGSHSPYVSSGPSLIPHSCPLKDRDWEVGGV